MKKIIYTLTPDQTDLISSDINGCDYCSYFDYASKFWTFYGSEMPTVITGI